MLGYDYDFIGFTYNGKHSIKDLHIYRTSNGDRYEENLVPNMREKTASVEGMTGLYYFGTQIEQKQINISFAFDNLSEVQLNNLKQVFSGDGIHPLILDEEPYKVYMAKVTGSNTVKHLCFENAGQREYRGEGTLQFTCYYPYARSRHDDEMPDKKKEGKFIGQFNEKGNLVMFEFQCDEKSIDLSKAQELLVGVISSSEEVVIEGIPTAWIEAKAEQIPNTKYYKIDTITITPQFEEGMSSFEFDTLKIDEHSYKYTSKGCFETAANKPSGKILNHYSIYDFPNKYQWFEASRLPLHALDNINHGDLPTTFSADITNNNYDPDQPKSISFGVETNNTIIVPDGFSKIKWDSKTGLISDLTTKALCHTTGNTLATIEPNEHYSIQMAEDGESLPEGKQPETVFTYDYLYY